MNNLILSTITVLGEASEDSDDSDDDGIFSSSE